MPAVLALGLDPVFVDPKAMGGYSPVMVRAFIDSHLDRVRAAGYEVENCLVDLGETAATVLSEKLRERSFDCVLIGAGLRAPEHSMLFEKLLNAVHSLATQAKICFNTTPGDSLEAVRRWV